MINRLCVIGVGLIGGSLALALKKAGYVNKVVGAGRNIEHLEKAKSLGIIDQCETDLGKAVSHADMVFIAVPLGAMAGVFNKIEPFLHKHTIVTDAGSAKHCVVEDATRELGVKVNQFIPGHPIAGTEKSGAIAAFDSLYQARRVIITPLEENSRDDINKVRAMWKAAGADVDEMGARHHDLVLAGTSHLPHILAFSLVDCLNQVDDVDEIFRFAAGGFRDFTRIASSDPVMWRDICLSNGEAVLAMMNRFENQLTTLKAAIENNDADALLEIFSRAKKARDGFCM
ncbi:MAG: prephenate dehydrogenase/arogenate dehydrogenase family protein [Gammaproteobacteria bacterium]|nr:prephenate dehydrogenase/arogenate dehydrogenase family protein [Gammaproteobacteria bacterium]